MRPTVPKRLIHSTQEVIDRYCLLDSSRPVIVAFSGGKDSFVLTLALHELGFAVLPVVVDMGYEKRWGERITALLRPFGIQAESVAVGFDRSGASENVPIGRRLRVLDDLRVNPSPDITPCTHCYSVKATLLRDAAIRHNSPSVAFGQHSTDAAASLLKEALFHIDRWEYGHERFSMRRFWRLVRSLEQEALAFDHRGPGPLLRATESLVERSRIDTDEPPRQDLMNDDTRIELVRPMFRVDELEIAKTRDEMGLTTEGSGCGHGLEESTYTPREAVHYGVLQRVKNERLTRHLSDLVARGLDGSGRGRVKARYRRQELIGNYKDTRLDEDKV